MENENKNNPLSFPSWILVLMTLSVPFLYVVGYFYLLGYLERFGLTNDFFPNSIEDYLINAFSAFLQLFLGILKLLTTPSFLIGLLLAFMAFITIVAFGVKIEKKVKDKVNIIKDSKLYSYLAFPFFAGITFISILYLLFIASIIFIFVPGFAVLGGDQVAEKQIEEFKGCNEETNDYNCVYLYSDGCLEESGFLIGRSQTHIAIYNGKQSRVFPLKDMEVRADVEPSESTAPKK